MSTTENTAVSRWEPTPRWQRRYREVLDVAATIFAEKSYAGASTRDIADRMGLRQASLYYYFPSKEAALHAICERGVKDFIENLERVIATPAPIQEKLRAAIANHLLALRTHPEGDYVRVFLRHRHELPDGPRRSIAALARSYTALIDRLFVEGRAKGELRADLDPHLNTLALLGLCNSVIANRSLPRAASIDKIVESYARIIIGGVVASGAQSKTARAHKPRPGAKAKHG
jgi:TetR/AcrR family transcriptional regulator, cholesterol catabolism regulator